MTNPQSLVQERLSNNSWGMLGSQGYVLGLDVGSYGLRAGLVDLHSHTYTSAQSDAKPANADATVEQLNSLVRELLEQQRVTSDRLVRVGVGFPGPVDARHGIILLSPRAPGWEQFPICERLEATFGATTLLDNDANLIALAEATFGVGRGVQHLVYIHLSSGVGGGLVLNGRLYQGATTTAGEIGHAVIGARDLSKPNERPRTLEECVSVSGLMRRAAELGLETDQLDDIFGSHLVGQQVVAEAADILALRLSQITALLDPQMIVLGGVVARYGGDGFVQAIRERMQLYMPLPVERSVSIVASTLGSESVVLGGVALALESMRE
jgi:glucokinase